MIHAHACPQCYEKATCDLDCTIEPDLGATNAGVPLSNHEVCQACEKAALSDSERALASIVHAAVEWGRTAGFDVRNPADVVAFDAVSAVIKELTRASVGLMTDDDEVTDKGRDLLDRARKAGVL